MAYPRSIRRQRVGARVLGIGMSLLVSLALACSGSTGEPMNSTSGGPVEVPPWACVPGETQPCPCPDGLEGLLTCDPQGAGFGECDCSPGAVSQGPPPTSGATETGSGSDSDSEGSSETTTVGPTTDPSGGTTTTTPDPTTSGASSSGPGSTTSGSSTSV